MSIRPARTERTSPVDSRTEPPADPLLVDSLLHPLALEIRQLLSRSEKAATGRILIDDEENILEALRAGVRLRSLFHAGEEVVSTPLRQALPPEVTIHEVAKRTGKKLFGNEKVSRVFAIAETPAPAALSVLADIPQDVVVLEDVSISGNIGAIVRTSVALGAGALVLLNTDPVDVYDRRLIRASRGLVFALPVITATTAELIELCRQQQLSLLVTMPHARTSLHEIAVLPRRVAIVFGSEKRGCSQELIDAATLHVTIPMSPRVESLNVSAAAGIVLFNRARFNGVAAD